MACYLTLLRQFLKIIWTLGNPFWHYLWELHCLTIPSHTHISASRSIQQRWSFVALPWRDHVQWERLPPGGRSYGCWLNYSGKKDWILGSFSTNMGAKIIHAWNDQGVDCWWGIFESTVKRRSIRASSGWKKQETKVFYDVTPIQCQFVEESTLHLVSMCCHNFLLHLFAEERKTYPLIARYQQYPNLWYHSAS